MGDRALSMSLDDYIKTQKKGRGKSQPQGGRGRSQSQAGRGKPQPQGGRPRFQGGRNLSQQHKTRYFSPNQNQQQSKGPSRPNRGGGNAGRGRINQPALGENSGKRKQTKGQFKRINNRLSAGGRNSQQQQQQRNYRPTQPNKVTLTQRTQRFGRGVASRIGTPQASSSRTQGPINNNFGNRNIRNRNNWPRNSNKTVTAAVSRAVSPRVARPAKNVKIGTPRPNIRVKNRQVQQLIQKRVQKARLTLTRKSAVAPPRVLGKPPRRGNNPAAVQNIRQAIVQQKLNRARNIKARNAKPVQRGGTQQPARRNNLRGLTLDRNQIVKVRVANDLPAYEMYDPQQPFYGPSSSSLPVASSSTYGYSAMPPDQFPSFILPNTSTSQRQDTSRQVLDPEIQRRISIIQNRARQNRDGTEILEDFKGPVNTCKMNPGDRFRLLMN